MDDLTNMLHPSYIHIDLVGFVVSYLVVSLRSGGARVSGNR